MKTFSLGDDSKASRVGRWWGEGVCMCQEGTDGSYAFVCLFMYLFIFETGFHFVALAGLELTEIWLPLLSEYWD